MSLFGVLFLILLAAAFAEALLNTTVSREQGLRLTGAGWLSLSLFAAAVLCWIFLLRPEPIAAPLAQSAKIEAQAAPEGRENQAAQAELRKLREEVADNERQMGEKEAQLANLHAQLEQQQAQLDSMAAQLAFNRPRNKTSAPITEPAAPAPELTEPEAVIAEATSDSKIAASDEEPTLRWQVESVMLNARTNPESGSTVVFVLNHKEQISQLDETEEWIKVRSSTGKIGWASKKFLSRIADGSLSANNS